MPGPRCAGIPGSLEFFQLRGWGGDSQRGGRLSPARLDHQGCQQEGGSVQLLLRLLELPQWSLFLVITIAAVVGLW